MTPNTPEPPPAPSTGADVWPLVVKDMEERNRIGTAKYGTPLRTGNGRKALVDAYQEVLDLAVYLRQEIEESPLVKENARLTRVLAALREENRHHFSRHAHASAIVRHFVDSQQRVMSRHLVEELLAVLEGKPKT